MVTSTTAASVDDMKIPMLLILATLSLTAADDPREVDRQALRAVLAKATEALNKRDLTALESMFHQPFVFVLSDQTMVTGMESLKKADAEWFSGPDAPILSLTFTPQVDVPAIFLSDTVAIASGTCTDTVVLRQGGEMQMSSRWTATVVKTADGWKVASVHAGVSPFANPVVTRLAGAIKSTGLWAIVGGLLVGAVLGLLLGRRLRRA